MDAIDIGKLQDCVARRVRLGAHERLRVVAGRVWLTQEGAPDDHWLHTGQEWATSRAVCLWLSAEPTATVQRLTSVTRPSRRSRSLRTGMRIVWTAAVGRLRSRWSTGAAGRA